MRNVVIIAVIVFVTLMVVRPDMRRRVVTFFRGAAHAVKEDVVADEPLDPDKVYTLAGDVHYHRKDCPLVEGHRAVPMPLEKARELYKPCPVCKPAQ